MWLIVVAVRGRRSRPGRELAAIFSSPGSFGILPTVTPSKPFFPHYSSPPPPLLVEALIEPADLLPLALGAHLTWLGKVVRT